MLINKFLFFAFFVISSFTTGFQRKTCEEVEYCSRLRYRNPEDLYAFDPESIQLSGDESTVTGTLLSNDGSLDQLILSVQFLQDSTVRLKITEQNLNRYELQDVLDGEPIIAKTELIVTVAGQTVIQSDGGLTIVKITHSPLLIEFLRNDIVELVLDGNDLVLENNDQSKAFAFRASFPEAVQLYGIHERSESLALPTTRHVTTDPYRLFNVGFTYDAHTTAALYGAVPVLYGHGNLTSGIFLHNAAQQWYDLINSNDGSDAYVITESGTLDIFVLLGPSPVEVVRQYVRLTGTGHLPQLWVLGYHQCRYSYYTQDEVKDVISNFDSHNFQLDTIWLDIDYTNGFRYFTWDSERFSDPVDLQNYIASTNRRLVTIIDPHIKADPDYEVYSGALEQDLFVHNNDGSVFEGNCWPGRSGYMDFLSPEARSYYASWYSYEKFQGATPVLAGIWNDMNEPSVFDIEEETAPLDTVHYGNVLHRDVHNLYGLLHTKSTHQGLMERDNGEKRPFILSRSHFAGTQRYSAIWTGDNFSGWDYLAVSYAQCLNANILGLVLCGADIAGFNSNPTDELFQRWYQAGIWLPFFRQHSGSNTNRREPYLFSEEVQNVVRNAMQLRYKHLPLWYTLAYEHVRTREPIVRPLFYQYPDDSNTITIDQQLLVGRDILVRAVSEPGATTVPVYFPGNDVWLSIIDSSVYSGQQLVDIATDIQSIPVYYRQGSVIVRKETIRGSSDEMINDGHTLFVSLGSDNTAHGTVYLDDNTSFKYQDNLEYNYLSLDFQGTDLTISKIDEDSNSENFDLLIDQIVFLNISKIPQKGIPGSYITKAYEKDAEGTPLKQIKIGGKTPTVIKL